MACHLYRKIISYLVQLNFLISTHLIAKTLSRIMGMFTRFYGEEWTEEYIHGFLFDLQRYIG